MDYRPAPIDSSERYSLRAFFEAGGRDYNDYLDWLKRKKSDDANAA